MKASLLIILAFICVSCSSIDISKLSQQKLLNTAYENKSEELLASFFKRWKENDLTKLNLIEPDSQILNSAIEIFHKIYNKPKTNSFIIFQDKIYYAVTDSFIYPNQMYFSSSGKYLFTDSVLKEFTIEEGFLRPPAKDTLNIIFLTPDYRTILFNFLKSEREIISERKKFINTVAILTPNETQPYIGKIQINPTLNKAIVELVYSTYSDCIVLEKKNKIWEMVKRIPIWVM